MEKQQPQKGNILAAQETDFTKMNDDQLAAHAMKLSKEQDVSVRRQYRELEEARTIQQARQDGTLFAVMSNGYEPSTGEYKPDSGADMIVSSSAAPERVSKFKKFRRFIGGLALTAIAFNATPASAETPTVSVEKVEDTSDNYYEQILGQAMQGAESKDTDANQEHEQAWDIEYLTDSKDKRYEKNFGPSYEGQMDKTSVVTDILERAKKDPAFLAAMTASCGAIEQGAVDACSLSYASDFSKREAAYGKLADMLQDEDTAMTHFVSEQTFSSTYFSGTKTETIDGKDVTVPKIGYSTNQKVRAGADDRQKYVAKFVNAKYKLDTELRADCGWQYNIVDEAEMAGVPQVSHELQQPESTETVTAGEIPVYAAIVPESKNPIAEVPKISIVTPEAPAAIPTPDKTPEQEVVVLQPETPKESEKTPESTPQPVAPEEALEEEPIKTVEPIIPVAPTPELEIDVPTEPVEPTKPIIPVAPTPELDIIVEPKPEPTPEVTPPPVVEKPTPTPEPKPTPKPELNAKDPNKSLDTMDGINPDKIEAGEVTKETKHENPITGDQQSVKEEVKNIKAPTVDKQAEPYKPLKQETGNTKPNETAETEKVAAEQAKQRKEQAATDARQAEIDADMKDAKKKSEAFESLRKSLEAKEAREKAERAERDRKSDELIKASRDARLAAEQAAKNPSPNGLNVKAETPTVTEDSTK